MSVHLPFYISPMLDTLFGVVIIFAFTKLLLKQNYIMSTIVATLSMAVITLVESVMFLLMNLMGNIIATMPIVWILLELLVPAIISIVVLKFFIARYSAKSRYKSKYLLAFSLPIFFIAVMLRLVNHIRYNVTINGIILNSDRIRNYEMVIIMVVAFLCVCIVLFAYEKTIKQMESENQKVILDVQISAQQSYVAEAKQKYEATKSFRHDFKNHIIALRGLINAGDMDKAKAYIERFEQTSVEITFAINTGNSVIDTLLGEKFTYAEQLGIKVKCDVTIPNNVKVDDFDLCAIFANAIDNAIKACNAVQNDIKTIDVVAKSNKGFFIIDMINSYQIGTVPKGSGMGLTTVQIIAEKYNGAMEITKSESEFRISVILPFGS